MQVGFLQHLSTCSAAQHLLSTSAPIQHLFGTSASVRHLSTCSALQHLFGTSAPVRHLSTCSAPISIFGCWVPALTPLGDFVKFVTKLYLQIVSSSEMIVDLRLLLRLDLFKQKNLKKSKRENDISTSD